MVAAVSDHARPRFWVATGTRDTADRWLIRHGWRPANWQLRERTVARRVAGRWNVSPCEAREIEAWRSAYLGPVPAWVSAVRLMRRSRTLAMWAVALRRFSVPKERP
jgi:hypothetical protein